LPQNSRFAVYPFSIYVVFITVFDNFFSRTSIIVNNEAEASRYFRVMLADYAAYVDFSILSEVCLQLILSDIMGKAANEYLPMFFVIHSGVGILLRKCIFALDLLSSVGYLFATDFEFPAQYMQCVFSAVVTNESEAAGLNWLEKRTGQFVDHQSAFTHGPERLKEVLEHHFVNLRTNTAYKDLYAIAVLDQAYCGELS
jgi:hypothetical protein